jgi:hypothetical protein
MIEMAEIADKKIGKIIILLGIIFGFFFRADFVLALELRYPTILGFSVNDTSTLPEYARYFFNIGMALAASIAVAAIAFGGIYYLVSFARGKFKDEGKDWIKAGILGLLLTVSAYLIAYTINPDLVAFRLNGLVPIFLNNPLSSTPPDSSSLLIYEEIPIGTLTENLLTRTMDCYDFDDYGDPIDGEQIKTDDNRTLLGPTYLEGNRADCFLYLAKAANSKAQTIKTLADRITEEMENCSCSKSSPLDSKSSTYSGGCVNKICKTTKNAKGETADCIYKGACPNTSAKNGCEEPCKDTCSNKGCSQSGNSQCCPAGVKQKIEHGPMAITDCYMQGKSYAGLDEFRSQYNNNYSAIKSKVELSPPVKVDGKTITIIKNGNCQTCKTSCGVCSSSCPACKPSDSACQKKCQQENTACQKNLQKCQEEIANCLENRLTCLKKNSVWYNLRLIDQLTYLKGKMDELKPKIQEDLSLLKKAESALGQCYLADTYIDFLKTYEQTDKDKYTILIERTYSDPETNELIKPAKYCQGFQYNNSTCYSQCQELCPGTTEADFYNYKSVPNCDDKADPASKKQCLAGQATKIKEYYDNRLCLENKSPFKTFKDCFLSCQQQCLNACDKLCLSEDKKKCKEACNSNSKCLLDNEEKCLINFNQLKNCADKNNSLKAQQSCADNAARCPYCSDQYAGYPDCLKNPYSKGEYSSSFMYQLQFVDKETNKLVCPEIYKTVVTNPNDSSNKNITDCLTLSPETSKCPPASKCPECPCDIIKETINYTTTPPILPAADPCSSTGGGVPGDCPSGTCRGSDGICSPGNCTENGGTGGTGGGGTGGTGDGGSSGGGSKTGTSETVLAYRVCSGTCDNSAYNDDPLTFYCKQSWWEKDEAKKTASLGNERICPKDGEIPVGQTIDDAEKWAQNFSDNIDNVTKKVQDLINYINDIIKEKNYCQCDSKCDAAGKEPACQAKCTFQQTKETITKPDSTTYTKPKCICVRQGCSGNPCQKMINLMLGKNAKDSCQEGVEYKGIDYYRNEISNGVKEFISSALKGSVSDIVKELSYSRKKTDECSLRQNNYGTEKRILSCTRVEDEIISPIIGGSTPGVAIVNGEATSSYCYGKALGAILKTSDPLADNWFCCDERRK